MENKLTDVGKGYLPMPTSVSRELVEGKFTATDIADFNKALVRSKMMVQTPALLFTKKLIEKGRSAIVTIPEGGGKTAIVESIGDLFWDGTPSTKEDEALFVEDEPEWVFIHDCPDANSLTKELWEWEGCPAPKLSEVWDKGRNGIFTKHGYGLTCFYCNRECALVRTEHLSLGYHKFEDDDVVMGLQRQGGDCPLISHRMYANLPQFINNLVIEIPKHPSREYLDILQALPRNRRLILLCPPEAEDSLHQAFPTLLVRKPPASPIGLLPQIYAQRLKDAGLVISPLTPSSLTLVAIISRGNPGRFLQIIGQLLDDIELDGCEETVSNAYVSRHIRDSINDRLAIQIVIEEIKQANVNWIKVKRIRQLLLEHFNLDVSEGRVGRLMGELDLEKRRNPDAEYCVGNYEVQDEVLGHLTERTEDTEEGGDQ